MCGISGRVRALNLTVPLGSGRVGSDNLGYGPGSGFSFEPVQISKQNTEAEGCSLGFFILQMSNAVTTSWYMLE